MHAKLIDFDNCTGGIVAHSIRQDARPELRTVYAERGLSLVLTDFKSNQPLLIESETFPCICMSIILDGRAQGDGAPIDTSFVPNEMWIASTSERFTTRTTIMPGSPVRTVELIVTSEWFAHHERRFDSDCAFNCMRAALHGPTSVRRRALDPRLKQIAMAIHHPPRGARLLSLHFEGRALDLLATLASEFSGPESRPTPNSLRARALDRIAAVRSQIDSDPAAAKTLADLARDFGMSGSKLRTDFHRAFGIHVGHYINTRRLDLGRDLIERDGLTVSEAAYRAGYAHPSNFTAAFRRRFGHPPSAFRR